MNEPEKIILESDPEAAKYVTVSGWMSRRGYFYGDRPDSEEMARYNGCTHRICDCGKPAHKNWTCCESCSKNRQKERYNKLEKKIWDGETPLYSQTTEECFHCEDEIRDCCLDNNCSLESLQLMICEPQYATPIDPNEYYYDLLPEDMELNNPELKQAFERLNETIEKSELLSWRPGKYAARIKVCRTFGFDCKGCPDCGTSAVSYPDGE